MDQALDAIQDSDVANVLRAIKDVEHHAATTTTSVNKGLKRRNKQANNELQRAKEALCKDMHRLLASPYARGQTKPSTLALNASAVSALRALWKLLQDMKNMAKQDTISEAVKARFETTMQQVVVAIDPGHSLPQEEEENKEPIPKGIPHVCPSSQRL